MKNIRPGSPIHKITRVAVSAAAGALVGFQAGPAGVIPGAVTGGLIQAVNDANMGDSREVRKQKQAEIAKQRAQQNLNKSLHKYL